MAERLSVSVALIALGLASQTVLPSTRLLAGAVSNTGGTSQTSGRTPETGNGVIAGVVVNDRQEPVARAEVQAFSVRMTTPRAQPRQTVPFSTRASGSASTDTAGRFQISGLEPGEYLVAARPVPSLTSGETSQTPIYATTFHPSSIGDQKAAPVFAVAFGAAPIKIELVRVEGARVSGSVLSSSGRPASGMAVSLFHRFGGFGSESTVAVVGANGTFEIPRVPPAWYRLSIAPRPGTSRVDAGEFATTLIEVQDRDLEGLSLVTSLGASISGRIVAEPGANIQIPLGLRVTAWPTPEEYSIPRLITATVGDDRSFRMTGLSGFSQFAVATDRAPFLAVSRIRVDGVEASATAGVELTGGAHEVVVFVTERESPKSTVDTTLSSGALVEQFKSEKVFWQQFPIAKAIVERHDASVLPSLAGWLSHEDRHVRGNAAFVVAGLGDARGFQIITDILSDRSDRPEGQGIATASSDGRYHVARQVSTDRYYAAHLLGDLRDPRAIPILVPLLNDPDVASIVPWALGQIGDKRAIGPLLAALDEDSPTMRVLAIYALETLHAREALPRLIALLNDDRKSNFGAQVSVAAAARAAIAKLQ
jgi:HEAT repeats